MKLRKQYKWLFSIETYGLRSRAPLILLLSVCSWRWYPIPICKWTIVPHRLHFYVWSYERLDATKRVLLPLTICSSIAQSVVSGIDIATNIWPLAIWIAISAIKLLVIAPLLSFRNETLYNSTKISGDIGNTRSSPNALFDVSNQSTVPNIRTESNTRNILYIGIAIRINSR